MDKTRYEKSGCAGSKGVEFQVSLLSVSFLNAIRKLTDWKLSTENKRAGKFDDVVLEWPEGSVLLQAKHKENKRRISLEDLLSTNLRNDDFSLIKYLLSYIEIKNEFKVPNVILCTNTDVHENVLEFLTQQNISCESILYYEDHQYTFYTFNNKILPLLKEKVIEYCEHQHSKNKTETEAIISENILQDFLQHFQFYINYPSGNDIGNVIEKLLCHLKGLNDLCGQTSSLEIYAKLMEWFQLRNGVYLTANHAATIFSEIHRNRHWQMLDKHNVHFQNNTIIQNTKQVLHFVTENGCLLQELKIFSALKEHKTKLLYVNSADNMDLQKQVVNAFQHPKYTFLLIIDSGSKKETQIVDIYGILRKFLEKHSYKKIIFLGKIKSELLKQIISDNSKCTIIKSPVTLKDLSKNTQEQLLKKEHILFQGQDISLEQLLATQAIETDKILNSDVLERLVRGEKIKVGTQIRPLHKNIASFYINRYFMREMERNDNNLKNLNNRKETLPEKYIYNVNEKVILISDSAGMGKTTVLTYLAKEIKEHYPQLWVIRIELNDYTGILKNFLKSKKKYIHLVDLLNSKQSTKLSGGFEEYIFTMNKKVVLMLDGVDEVSPDYTELIISLLVHCQEADNFAKVFVTTRPHMSLELQEKLQIKPFNLQPITRECQINFLASYWHFNLKLNFIDKGKCEHYAKTLLKTLDDWMEDAVSYGGIALQIQMIAEIFQENSSLEQSEYWQGCKEYANMTEEEPILPEKRNIMNLYNMFIERKRHIFIDKENPSGHTAANQALNIQFNECLIFYQQLALEEILSESQLEVFSCHEKCVDKIETVSLKTGIVQKINNKISFIHRTFAEYFVAECLLMELQRQNQSSTFQKFFINQVLVFYEFNVVRAFFNSFLTEIIESIPSDVFQIYQSLSDTNMFTTYNPRLIHKLAGEGCVAIVQLLFKCIQSESHSKSGTSDDVYITDVHLRNTLHKLQILMSEDGVNIKDTEGETPLHLAAENGHLDMVKFLVAHDADINIRSYERLVTPLHYASKQGHLNIIKFMVEKGADVKIEDYDGQTPLSQAIINRDTHIIEYLLDNLIENEGLNDTMIPYTLAYLGNVYSLRNAFDLGVDVNSTIGNGESLIFGAVRGMNLELVEYLIEKGADVNKSDCKGNTVLHLICSRYIFIAAAQLLLDLQINTDIQNCYGRTALHIAVQWDSMYYVQLLVEHEADVNIKDWEGFTALSIAIAESNLEIARYLVNHGAYTDIINEQGKTMLHLAVTSMSPLDSTKFILKYGVNINARDNYGWTALHTAASLTGQLDIVQYLLSQGADININDNDDRSVLHHAVSSSDEFIVKFILNLGIDVNVKDGNGRTPLFMSCKSSISQLLITQGAAVDVQDVYGFTPLFKAGDISNVECLVTNGCNVNVCSKEGLKATFFLPDETTESDHDEKIYNTWYEKPHSDSFWNILSIIEYLVESGVDINSRNNKGQTVLHVAILEHQLDTAKFFIKRLNIDVNIKDKNGRTALHLAVMEGLAFVKLLIDHGANINSKDFRGRTAATLAKRKGYLEIVEYLTKQTEFKRTRCLIC